MHLSEETLGHRLQVLEDLQEVLIVLNSLDRLCPHILVDCFRTILELKLIAVIIYKVMLVFSNTCNILS